jgi:hypothetical protein
MLIFWKERLVFLSTPKTGSTSVETALESMAHVAMRRPPELKHMSAPQFQRHMAPLLEQAAGERFTTVAMMRDPVDWVGSWYRFRQRDDLSRPEISTRGISFETAVEGYLATPPARNMDVGSQTQFLCADGDVPLVDRLFRYEAIDEFVDFLEDRLGCEILLPRLNVSPAAALDLSAPLRHRLDAHLAADHAIYRRLS